MGNFPTTTTNRSVIQALSALCSGYATPAALNLPQERRRLFIRARAFIIIVSLAIRVRSHLERHSLLKEMEGNSARIVMMPVMQRWENIIFSTQRKYWNDYIRVNVTKQQDPQFAILGYLDLFPAQRLWLVRSQVIHSSILVNQIPPLAAKPLERGWIRQ